MGRKAGMTAAERTAYLEGEFDQVVAQYEAEKGKMTLDQRIARTGLLARLSTGISQSDAADQRALKARLEADRQFLKIDAELSKARRSPTTASTVEGDEMDMDDEPNGGRDQRTAEELRLEIKGRLDLMARRVLARTIPGEVLERRASDASKDVDLPSGGQAAPT